MLDALLTGASDSFRNLASTGRAGCTKQLWRVCRRAFRNGDCDPLTLPSPQRGEGARESRPRKSSRTFRRRLKGTARPCWRGWARGESTPTEVDTGEAPPVGLVSTFRSAAGQPAVREALFIVWHRPGCRALVQSNGRGQAGRQWRKRACQDQESHIRRWLAARWSRSSLPSPFPLPLEEGRGKGEGRDERDQRAASHRRMWDS